MLQKNKGMKQTDTQREKRENEIHREKGRERESTTLPCQRRTLYSKSLALQMLAIGRLNNSSHASQDESLNPSIVH